MRYGFIVVAALAMVSCQTVKEKTQSRSAKSNAKLKLANQYARDGLLREAITTYKKILKSEPRNMSAHRNIGILYVKVGDYKSASKHLERSYRRYRNNFESNFYLGESYRARHKLGKAIYKYNKALEARPKSVKTLKALAWSYHKVRFYSEALKTTKKLSKLAPGDHGANIIASRTLVKLGRYNKALAVLKRGGALAQKGEMPYSLPL